MPPVPLYLWTIWRYTNAVIIIVIITGGWVWGGVNTKCAVWVRRQGTVIVGTIVVGHRAEYCGPLCQMPHLDQEEPGTQPCPHRRHGWHHSEC